MIFSVWAMLVLALAAFAWFSKANSSVVTLVFCVLSFPLLVGITKIATQTQICKLGNIDYVVRNYKVTLDAKNNPDKIYLFLDGTPPISCYIDFSLEDEKALNEADKTEQQGSQLIISGGNDLIIKYPTKGEPKPNGL